MEGQRMKGQRRMEGQRMKGQREGQRETGRATA
jgi:hypothetical protein